MVAGSALPLSSAEDDGIAAALSGDYAGMGRQLATTITSYKWAGGGGQLKKNHHGVPNLSQRYAHLQDWPALRSLSPSETGVGTELVEDVAWVGGEADGWTDGNVDRFGLSAKPPVLAIHDGSAGARSGSRETIQHYPSVKEECGE